MAATRGPVRMYSFQPYTRHFHEPDAISFPAIETSYGSRGAFLGFIDGVRPRLEWSVEHTSSPDRNED